MRCAGAKKTYRAANLAQALGAVRSELGPDAVILSARPVRQGGLLGIGRSSFEVCASAPTAGEDADRAPTKRSRTVATEIGNLRQTISRMCEEVRAARMESIQQRDAADAIVSRLNSEVHSASSALQSVLAEARLARRTGLPDAQVTVIRQLVDNGMELGNAEATVRASLQNSDDVNDVRRAVADFLMTQIRTAPALENTPGRHVVAFVGPTGVGKTTTIAKVAAAGLVAGRRVGLITTDTYRIAAVEQLKCYADLMGLKLEVSGDPPAVQRAVEQFHRCHLVLIDTAGRSPRATSEIDELAAMLSRAWVTQTHLVLPAGISSKDIRSVYRSFKRLGIDRIDWTKLDEATLFGSMFNGQLIVQRPANYLAAGQRVPEDLEAATPERIARLLLSTAASAC